MRSTRALLLTVLWTTSTLAEPSLLDPNPFPIRPSLTVVSELCAQTPKAKQGSYREVWCQGMTDKDPGAIPVPPRRPKPEALQ